MKRDVNYQELKQKGLPLRHPSTPFKRTVVTSVPVMFVLFEVSKAVSNQYLSVMLNCLLLLILTHVVFSLSRTIYLLSNQDLTPWIFSGTLYFTVEDTISEVRELDYLLKIHVETRLIANGRHEFVVSYKTPLQELLHSFIVPLESETTSKKVAVQTKDLTCLIRAMSAYPELKAKIFLADKDCPLQQQFKSELLEAANQVQPNTSRAKVSFSITKSSEAKSPIICCDCQKERADVPNELLYQYKGEQYCRPCLAQKMGRKS